MRKWWPLVAVCLGTFMLLVDVTIVNVALPAISDDLQPSFSGLQWVVDIYALALAALLLAAGTLADRLGHRRVYLVGLVLFALASLASGLAQDTWLLLIARALQGVGGAAMFATTFALLNANYQGRDRGAAYGAWGAVGGASAAFGPVVGGLLTEHLSWRWIFFVNLPVSVITVVLCLVVLGRDHGDRSQRVDVVGLVSFTVFAGALTYGLVKAGSDGWGHTGPIVSFVVSALALVAFIGWERRTPAPMLDLGLLGNRVFVGTLVAALVLSFSAFSGLVYVSLWLQSVKGLSPVGAGLAGGLPLSAAAFVTSAVSGRVLHGRRPDLVIAGGIGLIGLGGVITALQLDDGSSWPALVAGLVLIGIGVGLATPALSSTAMSAVPLRRGGMAAGTVNTARQLGLAVGIAVLGSVFTARATSTLTDSGIPSADGLARALGAGQAQAILGQAGPARAQLTDAIGSAYVGAITTVELTTGIVGLLAAAAIVVLMRVRAAATADDVAAPAGSQSGENGADVTAGDASAGAAAAR